MCLPEQAAKALARSVSDASSRHRCLWLRDVLRELLLGSGHQTRVGQTAPIRRSRENLSRARSRVLGGIPVARRRHQEPAVYASGKNGASVSTQTISQGGSLGRAKVANNRCKRERISGLRVASARHVAAASVHARTVRLVSKNHARCFSAGDPKSSPLPHHRSLDHPPHRLVLHQPAETDRSSRGRHRRGASAAARIPRGLSY